MRDHTWPRPGTHCHRLLAVLKASPGDWCANLYQRLGVMVHSRVADLRSHGYRVESRCAGRGRYEYRIVTEEPR
ncbi:MAG TPA: hypothetical protein VGN26_04110 [Armatimonadota bacterium]|jgi:hypothetical protein